MARAVASMLLAAGLGWSARCSVANAASEPVRHVDLARLAWPSAEAERADRRVLDALRDSLERGAGEPISTPARLLELLVLDERSSRLTYWHADYHHVRAALDTRDEASARAEDSLWAAQGRSEAPLERRLGELGSAKLERFLAHEPRLGPYAPYLEDLLRQSPHRLSDRETALAQATRGWQFDLYARLIDRTTFGMVSGPKGPLDVWKDRGEIAESPDSALRQAGAARLAGDLRASRDLFAFALLHTIEARNAIAHARGYADAAAQIYDERHLDTPQVRSLIATARARGALYRRFEAAVARSRAVLRGTEPPRLTVDQAAGAMTEALASLGPEIAREVKSLLDAGERRLDLGPAEHRRPGGFSFVLPHGVHGVYLESFGGTPASTSRLVHESGHAIHKTIFEASGLPALYAPAFSEAVAQFGEVVVTQHLADIASSPAEALYWRRQSLQKLLEIFAGARDADLEQSLYDAAEAGTLKSADDIDRVTAAVDSAYTSDRRPEAAGRWMRNDLLFEDPFYLSNYLFSGAIILALVRQHEADPSAFADRYARFLRQPDALPPRAILERTLGVRLDSPEFTRDAFTLLETRIGAFETEVARLADAPVPSGGR